MECLKWLFQLFFVEVEKLVKLCFPSPGIPGERMISARVTVLSIDRCTQSCSAVPVLKVNEGRKRIWSNCTGCFCWRISGCYSTLCGQRMCVLFYYFILLFNKEWFFPTSLNKWGQPTNAWFLNIFCVLSTLEKLGGKIKKTRLSPFKEIVVQIKCIFNCSALKKNLKWKSLTVSALKTLGELTCLLSRPRETMRIH